MLTNDIEFITIINHYYNNSRPHIIDTKKTRDMLWS
jgi:hypothetical protein